MDGIFMRLDNQGLDEALEDELMESANNNGDLSVRSLFDLSGVVW